MKTTFVFNIGFICLPKNIPYYKYVAILMDMTSVIIYNRSSNLPIFLMLSDFDDVCIPK